MQKLFESRAGATEVKGGKTSEESGLLKPRSSAYIAMLTKSPAG
jgi:hypothetical protein